MDTVPVGSGWTKPGLQATVQNGRIYGRGSADMKAGLAVGLGVMEAWRDKTPKSDIVLALSVDEEAPKMLGIHALVREKFIRKDDQMIALEPTGLNLRIAHMGLRWLKVTTHGRMAHAGRAHLGIDANHIMAKVIDRLKTKVRELEFDDPLLGKPRFTCGVITGGVATNVVPGKCEAQFDLRLVPPMTKEAMDEVVHQVLQETTAAFEGSRYEVEALGLYRPPVQASNTAKIVQELRRAYKQVTGNVLESGGPDGHEAYTDAAMAAALLGSKNCIAFGPGSSDVAHTADEFVPISDIETACRVMEVLVQQW
jgi:succinyl-diaminopimelate desuccinylase